MVHTSCHHLSHYNVGKAMVLHLLARLWAWRTPAVFGPFHCWFTSALFLVSPCLHSTVDLGCEAEATWYSEGVKDTGTRLDGSEAHPCGLLIAWLSGDSISKCVKWDTSMYLQGLLGRLDVFLALHFKKCLGNFNCYQEFIPKLHWNLLVTCLMYLLGWEPWKGRVVSAVWP